jgi:hypothetical protein
MCNKVNENWPISDDRSNVTLLSTIFAHYIHQNTLMYSRSNIVLALQGAGFAAGWTGGQLWGGLALLATGLITICLKQMIKRDRQCRNANLPLMKSIEDKLLPGDTWIAKDAITNSSFPRKIRVGVPAHKKWKEAGFLYNNVISTLIVIDFFIAFITFLGLYHP